MNSKQKRASRAPEVDRLTPELEALLAEFSDDEIESGVIAGPSRTDTARHTHDELVQRLDNAILETSLDRLLKRARKTCNMSVTELSEVLRVSRARAHQLEQAGANLQLETLQRTADALGYDVQITFLPRDENKAAIVAPVP